MHLQLLLLLYLLLFHYSFSGPTCQEILFFLDRISPGCYAERRILHIGSRLWKLGASPTQGRCCISPKLPQNATGDTLGRRGSGVRRTRAISQNTCLFPARFSRACSVLRTSGIPNEKHWQSRGAVGPFGSFSVRRTAVGGFSYLRQAVPLTMQYEK